MVIVDHRPVTSDHKMKKQAVRPRFPARYRPARVNTRVLGCPAQPALSSALTQKMPTPQTGPGPPLINQALMAPMTSEQSSLRRLRREGHRPIVFPQPAASSRCRGDTRGPSRLVYSVSRCAARIARLKIPGTRSSAFSAQLPSGTTVKSAVSKIHPKPDFARNAERHSTSPRRFVRKLSQTTA
jgi:hypothetical protein